VAELIYRKGKGENDDDNGNGNGKERRKENVLLNVLAERVHNIIMERQAECRRYDDALKALDLDLTAMRQQTHDWMQRLNNRLPPWVVLVLSGAGTAIGAMAMWILTHAGGGKG